MNSCKHLLLLVIILAFCSSSLALEINEVMYNPATSMSDDSDLEWIEIYNNDTEKVDLSNFTINTKDFDDVIIFPGQYLVIARELIDGSDKDNDSFENYYGNGDSVWNLTDGNFTAVDSGAFNLGNTGDIVKISDRLIEVEKSYLDDFGGDGNGNTICLLGGIWQECLPTPGYENVAVPEEIVEDKTENIVLSTYLEETIYKDNKYTKLFKIKIEDKESCSEKDTIAVNYNITNGNLVKEDFFTKDIGCSSSASTGEFTPEDAGNYTLCGMISNSTVNETDLTDNQDCMSFEVIDPYAVSCDVSLELDFEQTSIYNKGDSIKFKHLLNNESFPYVIEYWVEDLFGNIVKSKYNTTNTNQKSWKTNIEEEDRVLSIKSLLYPSCKDINETDNYAEKMFIVISDEFSATSEESSGDKNSDIEITKITPAEISFGEMIKADVEIYKNSTNKYSLSAWVEKDGKKISEKTKINLKNKDTSYKVTLPIQLDPNCDSKTSEGEADLVVEGLGEKAGQKISLSGINSKLCKETKTGGSATTTNKLSYDLEVPSSIKQGEEFSVMIKVSNDDQEHEFEVWSYLYRGSKCYSCLEGEREDNLESFALKENKDKEIKLTVNADKDLKEGEYNLKVKVRKDNQKTTRDFTENIVVEAEEGSASSKEDSITYLSEPSKQDSPDTEKEEISHQGKGIVIYESSSEKAKKLIPSFLAVTFGLLSLGLVFKKK